MIRDAIHRVARNRALGSAIAHGPLSPILERFVGGDTVQQAVSTAVDIANEGYHVSLERSIGMGDAPVDVAAVTRDISASIVAVAQAGIAPITEIAVFPKAIGMDVGADLADVRERLDAICTEAEQVDASVMVGMGSRRLVDQTLTLVREVRSSGMPVGVTLQAAMRRTREDCVALGDGPIRLVKGAYRVHGGDVYTSPIEVDKSFIRSARTLLQQDTPASFATHDTRVISIIDSLVETYKKPPADVEFAFYLGRHPNEQQRLLARGFAVRIYIPFGPQWFERLVDGFAERPSGLSSAVRSLLTLPSPT
jgi:proline dehydrogenase